ncbi:hypothetical protein SAMN05421854_101476 [Amycolatopsis rubida]|uniref:HTH cro/C1-type domain-containing protein n=1 Tax=Amycolatopsis rubida TaxID=112413 RepID=A0A1I5E3H8_9PSEU|nr:hypothetical protein SAMN05421854_101476 [Amycolatopsis rubida]
MLLGCGLRTARKAKGWKMRELARETPVNAALFNCWELGRRSPHLEDVIALSTKIGITTAHRDRLIRLARHPEEDSVLALGAPDRPDHLAVAEDCARRSSRIDTWNPLLVPPMFQIPDYTAALTGPRRDHRTGTHACTESWAPDRPESDALVEAVTVYIGEHAIAHPIGARHTAFRQLHYLLEAEPHPLTRPRRLRFAAPRIRVVPIRAGYHQGLDGAVTRYHTEAGLIDYRPGGFAGTFTAPDRNEYELPIDAFDVFNQLDTVALSTSESAELIYDYALRLKPGPPPARPSHIARTG